MQSKNTANVVDLPTLFTYNKDNTGDKVLASTANVADSAELTRVLGTAKNAATRTNGQFYTNYYLNNVSAKRGQRRSSRARTRTSRSYR